MSYELHLLLTWSSVIILRYLKWCDMMYLLSSWCDKSLISCCEFKTKAASRFSKSRPRSCLHAITGSPHCQHRSPIASPEAKQMLSILKQRAGVNPETCRILLLPPAETELYDIFWGPSAYTWPCPVWALVWYWNTRRHHPKQLPSKQTKQHIHNTYITHT